MSRVDDAAEERRAEEARLADRRAKERVQKDRVVQETAFDRALSQRSGEQARQGFKAAEDRAKAAEAPRTGSDVLRAAKQSGEKGAQTAQQGLAAAQAKEGQTLSQQALADRAEKHPEDRGAALRQAQVKAPTPQARNPAEAARSEARGDAKLREALTELHKVDAKTEDIDKQTATGGAKKKQGPVERTSDDSGGEDSGKGSGKGDKDKGSATFRLPPAALMALPPLARPKDAGGLRGMTQEIVDKIVSRVLVGTNRAGDSEFRIDLKSSALKGLSIRVSGGRGGKIRAVFSGSDREVLAALKKSSRDLVEALAARGLVLEDLLFEDSERR